MKHITDLLPGYNCGECGLRQCRDFADALIKGDIELISCVHLYKDRTAHATAQLEKILNELKKNKINESQTDEGSFRISGVIDGLEADFTLAPLPGEPSCREDLHPFDQGVKPKSGEYLRYRPLGCPVTHFARVLAVHNGIITVHMVGPLHRIKGKDITFQDIGICLVIGFDGIVGRGRVPDVSETVKFLPEHCMMQKVHSGVVVHSEGNRTRIEGIDLKVW
jgi:uncharacterized Fe-S cluster-containing protein